MWAYRVPDRIRSPTRSRDHEAIYKKIGFRAGDADVRHGDAAAPVRRSGRRRSSSARSRTCGGRMAPASSRALRHRPAVIIRRRGRRSGWPAAAAVADRRAAVAVRRRSRAPPPLLRAPLPRQPRQNVPPQCAAVCASAVSKKQPATMIWCMSSKKSIGLLSGTRKETTKTHKQTTSIPSFSETLGSWASTW